MAFHVRSEAVKLCYEVDGSSDLGAEADANAKTDCLQSAEADNKLCHGKKSFPEDNSKQADDFSNIFITKGRNQFLIEILP